jgi:adrenodoxin-NADP+ reductase
MLNIPGETTLKNVFGARDFVGWYNGAPSLRDLPVDLERTDTAVIIGQGNVALDVARVLLTPVDVLSKTDMTEYALEKLRTSRIRRVHIVGRRGPLQVAFTSKELREMLQIPQTTLRYDHEMLRKEMDSHSEQLNRDRARKRLMSLLANAPNEQDESSRTWFLNFMKSPSKLLSDNTGSGFVSGVELRHNRLDGDDYTRAKAIPTSETSTIDAGLVLRSIGYQIVPVPGLPFNHDKGIVPHIQGRVIDGDNNVMLNTYVAGWLKTGPVGVIAATMYDAFQTADAVDQDLSDLDASPKSSYEDTLSWLKQTSPTRPIDFDDWKAIEKEEQRRGKARGKPQEKFTSTCEIMEYLESIGR